MSWIKLDQCGGRFNGWNHFPSGLNAAALDDCNATHLDDGSWNQVGNSPFGGEYGEPVSTNITFFVQNDDGSYIMELDAMGSATGTSSVIYRQVDGSDYCWEIEMRVDKNLAGVVQTSCRDTPLQAVSRGRSAVHGHEH